MKNNQKALGLTLGIVASICFGLIPLFTLPIMKHGMHTPSILSYRFLLTALFLFILARVRHISLRVTRKQLRILVLLGLIYTGSATVVHFTYPVYVIILMLLIYKQKPHPVTVMAIVVAFLGVASIGGLFGSSEPVSTKGFVIVALAGIAYASYLVIVNKSAVKELGPIPLSFWALLSSSIFFLLISFSSGGLQWVTEPTDWLLLMMLALVCTVIANILTVETIKLVGSTITSVLGAIDPLTAVLVGYFVFDESLDTARGVGIALIVISVLLIALGGRIAYILKVYALRHRHH